MLFSNKRQVHVNCLEILDGYRAGWDHQFELDTKKSRQIERIMYQTTTIWKIRAESKVNFVVW